MTQYTHSTNGNTNHTGIDWTQLFAQAMLQGGQAFIKTITDSPSTVTDAQLQTDETRVDQRYARALDQAKRDRTNPDLHILSMVRNWSRKQALALVKQKVAGKQIRTDFYQIFQDELQQEITSLVTDLQLFWQQEDEQRKVVEQRQAIAQREQAEQAFQDAYPLVNGLHTALLNGEQHRQRIFNDGQQAAQGWANKYEDSVNKRERIAEDRENRLKEREDRDYDHQRAMRALMVNDQRASFADTVVRTGKNTIGCLIIWFLVIASILLAIYFAFPHH